MAIQKITIEEFLLLAKTNLVLDVRSPSEFAHAHMPNAKNMALFNDYERKIVGTAYKQESKEQAIKLGLDFFGKKMRGMVEEVEQLAVGSWQLAKSKEQAASSKQQLAESDLLIEADCQLPTANCILINCWRGGMRSAGVAWLLDLYGFKVYTLVGGYKAYRNWVLQQFEKDYHFKIIGGYTGSGKTLLLDALAKENNAMIDLEGLANHKGSALGALGQLPQPSQEMFENLLAKELEDKSRTTNDRQQTTDDGRYELHNESSKYNEPIVHCPPPTAHCIWLEDESQRIGNLQIPMQLWRTMRNSKVYFFDIPFEERLNYLTKEYGVQKKDELVTAIMRIQKRLGGLETKNAINFLLENNFKESFRILLTYYDKYYSKGLYNRENAETLVKKISATEVNTDKNMLLLLNITDRVM
jgi:tRNA 2-selenouridine synthase